MFKKRPTARVARQFATGLVALSVVIGGHSLAQVSVDGNGNDLLADSSLYVSAPSFNCGADAQALADAAAAAANRAIAGVNNQVQRIGDEARTKRACLENINRLISLSMPNFGSLSGIIGKVMAGIINAIINKACAAAVGAINTAVNTVNNEIQGAKNQVMAPINGVRNAYSQATNGGGGTQWVDPATATNAATSVLGSNVVTPADPAAAPAGSVGPAAPTASAYRAPSANSAPPGAKAAPAAPASRAAAPAPAAPAPTQAAPAAPVEPKGWSSLSCKIFGGCK